jgi:spore coat protein CotH
VTGCKFAADLRRGAEIASDRVARVDGPCQHSLEQKRGLLLMSSLLRALLPLLITIGASLAGLGCGDNLSAEPTVDDGDDSSDQDDGDDGDDGDDTDDGGDSSDAFAVDRVLAVDIEMAPEDWDALRAQGNDVFSLLGPACQDAPPERGFTWFTADVTIDGEALPSVAVRKKGFFGSLSLSRPSFKLDLDRNVDDREWRGLEKLTLNNNQQDGSALRTCVAYSVFRAAGVPAPRCSFARVSVNGEDLGVYSNVESVTPRMLERWFDDGKGSLYEGTASDVRPGWSATYEQKNDDLVGDRSDLDDLTAAIEAASDADLLAAVSARVDVDGFMTFWAAENLIGHWDSYSNTANNHFLYREPGGDQFHFLPWGPDQAFLPADRFAPAPETRPRSVSANGWVAHRLYALPEVRERYVDTMVALLEDVWDEAALLGEVDRMAALVGPLAADPVQYDVEVEKVRSFIRDRRAQIEPELEAGGADWEIGPRASPCLELGGSLAGSFATTWGTTAVGNPFGTGTGTLVLTVDGVETEAMPVGAAAGLDTDFGLGRRQMIQVGGILPDGARALLFLVAPEVYRPGADVPLDWQSAFAVLARIEGTALIIDGLLANGAVHLDEAGDAEKAEVTGTFSSELLRAQPAP